MFSSTVYERPIVRSDFSSNDPMEVEPRYSTPKHSNNFSPISPARILHNDNDVIFSNGFDQPTFHPPVTRKVTKVASSESFDKTFNEMKRN